MRIPRARRGRSGCPHPGLVARDMAASVLPRSQSRIARVMSDSSVREPDIAPDRRVVSLSHGLGGQVLLQRLTGEVCALPRGVQPWQRLQDEAGRSYLCDGSGTEWAANFLEHPLFVGDGTNEFRIQNYDDYEPLGLWLRQRRGDRSFCLAFPPHGERKFHVFVSQVPLRGASVWWSLLCLYKELRLHGKGSAGDWAAAGFQRWSKFLAERCDLSMHLVNKVGSGLDKSDEQLGHMVLEARGDRAANDRMCSSLAVVALLAKWALAPQKFGGLAYKEDRAASLGFLEAWVVAAQPTDFVFFLSGVGLSGEGWPIGAKSIVVPCVGGSVALHPMLHRKQRMCIEVCRKFPAIVQDERRSIDICDFLAGLLNEPMNLAL